MRETLTGRQARYGSNALILTVAFVGILVVINLVGYNNSRRWDLTEDKTHTLAPETVQALQKLPGAVSATAYFSRNSNPSTARNLLDEMKTSAKGKFDYRFIDPDADPVSAQQDNIGQGQDGVIILRMGDQKEKVSFADEQQITTSLIRLTNPGERVIYFLTGHGEKDPDGSGDTTYSTAKSALTSKNYMVKTISLLVDHAIPKDARAIVIAGPQKPLAESEIDVIRGYIANGGSAVILVDPPLITDNSAYKPDPLETYLTKDWGIQLKNDLVIDIAVNPPTVAAANEYGNSPITNTLLQNHLVTVFPESRSLQVDPQAKQNTVLLVKTAPGTWAETDLAALKNNKAAPDNGKDILGPITLAVSFEDTAKGSRVVVVGDSDFASNGVFNTLGNGDLFINMVDWASKQDNLINLTPKSQTNRMMLPPQRYTLGLILLGSVFVVPGAILASGLGVWLQRRRRG
ncbi:MAG TPA: GldG family protein [Anaerolineaceae bacterium]|nr:GldG family protein [Anaerolineaceae bacterium]